jgi:hypothetical protein
MKPSSNTRLQRTRFALLRSPLSRMPLGAYGKGLGRASGESVESRRRRELFQSQGRRPHQRPGPVGSWRVRQVEQHAVDQLHRIA